MIIYQLVYINKNFKNWAFLHSRRYLSLVLLGVYCDVTIAKLSQKQLKKLPAPIVLKLQAWIDGIKASGLPEIRKIP